ncbi:MAG: hypothetical protein Q9168_000727 [Polycauliona sp. 1 TL-2023]
MIQANSLSSVVRLAENPPASPFSETDALDPLVLYFARVPGSRGLTGPERDYMADIFLTTTKPLQRVVTAQDVQSSLYYVHLDSQDDERLRQTIAGSSLDADQSLTAHQSSYSLPHVEPGFERLALTDPTVVIHRLDPSQPAANNHQTSLPVMPPPTTIVRKPVGQRSQPEIQAVRSKLDPSGAHIIGPRAMHPRLHSVDSPGLRLAHGKENLMPRRWSEQPPITLPSMSHKATAVEHIAASAQDPNAWYGSPAEPLNSLDKRAGSTPSLEDKVQSIQKREDDLSLTLIRRYDGSQWNVGKVFNAYQTGNHTEKCASSQSNDMAIQITTPGYSKYQLPTFLQASVASPQIFERRLFKPRRRSEENRSECNSPSRRDQPISRMSIDFHRLSKPRLGRPHDFDEYPKRLQEEKSTGTKGYTFSSPWNGTCEFSSGVIGQTLKCKHTAPEQGSQAVTVSELRFNLPTSSGLGTASPNVLPSPERPRSSKRSSYFAGKRGSESTYSEDSGRVRTDNEDENKQLDLSLGQERAGGGFAGRQVKLGKLIVEPEGLKMLDLLIAANISLWWKVYERSA